jgi:phosphoglycolate phosphatase
MRCYNSDMHICLFDIDGTLLLSGGAGKAAMEQALAAAFNVPASSDGIPFSGRTDRAIARDLFQLHEVPQSPENWKRFLAAYLEHLPTCLHSYQGQVLPGICAFLDHLSERTNVAVGLLTGNVRDGARLKLGHYGLYHRFPFGGFGDEHLERNAVAREALAAVRQHCNGSVDCNRVWVIGDTPLDVACARSIGARAVAVATGWHSYDALAAEQPDVLLRDFSNPEPLLARW